MGLGPPPIQPCGPCPPPPLPRELGQVDTWDCPVCARKGVPLVGGSTSCPTHTQWGLQRPGSKVGGMELVQRFQEVEVGLQDGFTLPEGASSARAATL